MIFSKLAKSKKIFSLLLLFSLLTPLFIKPILAYDSNPQSGDVDMIEYFNDVYEPAIEAPEMNLESFINETFKGLVFGVPFYYLTRSPIAPMYYAFICFYKAASGEIGDALACMLEHIDLVDETIELIRELMDIFFSQGPSQHAVAQAKTFPEIISSTLSNFQKSSQYLPASGFQFFEYYRQKLGLATPVYAQGAGYAGLGALIPYWTAFRNFAYILFTIGFVIAGFMIMFRMKISPQAVVTVQTVIPKIVIALILVTFSYAIVGFLLDIIWVISLLAINLIGGIADALYDIPITPDLIRSVAEERNNALVFIFQHGTRQGLIAVFAGLGTLVYALLGGLGMAVYEVLAIILFLILGIVVIWTAIKITFMLIKAFIFIVLYTVIAPLWIFLGVIPGVNGFGSWFREILSHVIVFPVTVTLLTLSVVFMEGRGIEGTESINLPLMGRWSPQHAIMVLGLGMLLFTPKAANILQSIMKTARIGEGAAIGEALGPVTGTARYAWGGARGAGAQVIGEYAAGRTGGDTRGAKIWGYVERGATGFGYRPSKRRPTEETITDQA